jgi:DNA-binding MarR family transcriptional regulator
MRLYGAAGDRFDNVIAGLVGLNRTDMTCLEVLSRSGQLTAGELAAAAGLTSGGTTAVLDRLEARGLVVRDRDPDDRRRVVLHPTDEAHARIAPYFLGLVDASRSVLADYSDEQLELVLAFVRGGRRVLDEQADTLRSAGAPGDEDTRG